MKTILAIMMSLSLTGCIETKLKAGDCAMTGDYKILKIVRVGEHGGYEIMNDYCKIGNWSSSHGGLNQTDCFDSFKQCEEKK